MVNRSFKYVVEKGRNQTNKQQKKKTLDIRHRHFDLQNKPNIRGLTDGTVTYKGLNVKEKMMIDQWLNKPSVIK